MKPHWESVVKTPEERKVFECLSDPNWDYRTIEGIKVDTGLAEEQIEAILTRYGDQLVHKAAVQDKFGRDLYTLAGTQPAAATAAALKPKKKVLPIVLSTVSFVIAMSIFKECQREQLARQQAERTNTIVTGLLAQTGVCFLTRTWRFSTRETTTFGSAPEMDRSWSSTVRSELRPANAAITDLHAKEISSQHPFKPCPHPKCVCCRP